MTPPPKPWYALRHTFCTELARAGVPVNVIKELAGHKSIETTLRYMHTDRAAKREAVNALRGTDAKRDVRAENREGASANADSWTVTSERSPLPT